MIIVTVLYRLLIIASLRMYVKGEYINLIKEL